QVRVASEGDADHVARLMAAFRDWWERDKPTDEQIAVGVARLLIDPHTEFLLAGPDAARPAGVCQLRYRYGLWYDGLDCWLEDMYVDADARGLGVGRALGEAAIERASIRGCRRVQLDVNEANPDALALYRRLGFDEIQDPPGGRLLLMTSWVE
ncbi:MAG TPA: GNAT family N-acetyltransferase, partial [Solirubrobacterales bacterium]|nr:GNAT family N-acetyltransferase [Solirubrobacterales bacterium]